MFPAFAARVSSLVKCTSIALQLTGKRCISIPATSKAAVVDRYGGALQIKELPTPEPKYGQVLVKIHASGCCHTDVHAVDGDWPIKATLPLIPGHEGAGEVVAVSAVS